MGVSENRGTLFRGPDNKDPTIQDATLGSPTFGNPPYMLTQMSLYMPICIHLTR